MDIYDIPIVLITEQYLDYVSKMDTKDMDVMSEFLVMAATLVRIKSKMLLPVEEEEEEEFEDPRQELVERILEYKMYKYASYELKDRQVDAGRMVFKEPSIPEEIQDFKEDVAIEDLLSDVTLAKLQGIFNSVMKNRWTRSTRSEANSERLKKKRSVWKIISYFWIPMRKNIRRSAFGNYWKMVPEKLMS